VRSRRMTTLKWMSALGVAVADLAVILYAPLPWAMAALWFTVSALVLAALSLLIRWGNRGPGKTLY
jgi:hypothetical protein